MGLLRAVEKRVCHALTWGGNATNACPKLLEPIQSLFGPHPQMTSNSHSRQSRRMDMNMTKYCLIFALFSAMGCAVTPADDAGSASAAVNGKPTSGVVGSGEAANDKGGDAANDKGGDKGGDKGNGCDPGAPPAPVGDACESELAAISALLKTVTDPAQAGALKEKYAAVSSSCQPVNESPCAAELAAIQASLDAAIKSGDVALIGALKEKYAAILASCATEASDGTKTPPPVK